MHQTFVCRDGKNTVQIPNSVIAVARIDYRDISERVACGALRGYLTQHDIDSYDKHLVADVGKFVFIVGMFEKDARTDSFLGVWAPLDDRWYRLSTLNSTWRAPYTAYNVAVNTLPNLKWAVDGMVVRSILPNNATLNIGGYMNEFTVGGQWVNCRSPYNPDSRKDLPSLSERLLAHAVLMLNP